MISPAPTSKIDPKLARGVLVGTGPALVKISFPNTSYELHLVTEGAIAATPGKRIVGVIRGQARRIDVVQTGGRYVEPLAGRPRRVQGTVIAVDGAANALVVDAGMPIHVTPTDARQRATDFELGVMVSFDVQEGVGFAPAAG